MPSLAFRQAAYAQSTSETVLAIMALTHSSFVGSPDFPDGVMRIVSDLVDIESSVGDPNGSARNFTAAPFRVVLPPDVANQYPKAVFEVFDATGILTPRILEVEGEIMARLDLILASQPDVAERSFPKFILRNAKSGAARLIQFDMEMRKAGRPWPGYRMDPVNFPGLF